MEAQFAIQDPTLQSLTPLRSSFWLAAINYQRSDPTLPVLAKVYREMVAKGKPAKVAIIACARKLLVHLNGLMRTALIEAGKIAPESPASSAMPAVV